MQANYDHEQLIDYIEGELPPESMARVDALLATDPKLRRLIEAMKADRAALRAMPEEAMPFPVVDDLLAGMERQMLLGEAPGGEAADPITADAQRHRMRIGPRLLRVASYTGIAAVLAVVVSVVVIFLTDLTLFDELKPSHWETGATLADGSAGPHAREADRLALEDLDRIGTTDPTPPIDAGKAGEAADASLAMADTPSPSVPRDTFSKAGPVFRKDAGGEVAEAVTGDLANEVNGLVRLARADRSRFNAARVAGNRGQFALNLPSTDEANVKMEVVSDNARETTASLNTWLDANDAQIVPAKQALVGFDKEVAVGGAWLKTKVNGKAAAKMAARRPIEAYNDAYQLAPGDEVYCVVIDNKQVPELVAYMNQTRDGRQRARLVEAPQPQRLALAEVERAVRASEPAQPAESVANEMEQAEAAEASVADAVSRERSVVVEAELARQTPPMPTPEPVTAATTPVRQEQAAVAAQTDLEELAIESDAALAESVEGVTQAKPEAAGQEAEQLNTTTQSDRRTTVAGSVVPETVQQRQLVQQQKPAADHDEALLAEINAFNWGAVLGNQLPLANQTPLVLADPGRVVLPVVIRESRISDEDATLGERLDDTAEQPEAVPNGPLEVETDDAS